MIDGWTHSESDYSEEVEPEIEVEPAAEVSIPENCGHEAYDCLLGFERLFAQIPKGELYLPHLGAVQRSIDSNRTEILEELSRAHARGRC